MENQSKTTFSLRLTIEQKALLQEWQGQFANQMEFVDFLLDSLGNVNYSQLTENETIVKSEFLPYEMELLRWVCERESTEDVEIVPDDLFKFMFNQILIRGDKFSLNSIPNSVINRIKKEFSND